MAQEAAAQEADRDAVAKRIRLQFIKQAIEAAFDLTHLALAEGAAGHAELAEKAKRRALMTYKDFRAYLPSISNHLTGPERGECEESLNNLREALQSLK